MIKGMISCFLFISLMSSCAALQFPADRYISKVKLGMTRDELQSLLGPRFELAGEAENTAVWSYRSYNGYYKFYFYRGELKEWSKDYINDSSSGSDTDFSVTSDAAGSKGQHKSGTDSAMKAHLDAHRNAMLSTAGSDEQKKAISLHMDAHEKAVLGKP